MQQEPTLDELVRYANELIQWRGLEKFINSEYYASACGCMGPRDGYTVCHCMMNYFVHKHKVQVLEKINGDAALTLMRQRLISALSG